MKRLRIYCISLKTNTCRRAKGKIHQKYPYLLFVKLNMKQVTEIIISNEELNSSIVYMEAIIESGKQYNECRLCKIMPTRSKQTL
jgi:hypothetical protein